MEFKQSVKEALAYYVYALVDPRDHKIFYIGKGKDNRVFQHAAATIDEIEQGLEPDRIVMLTRIFKEISKGQVFITTHSMNVVLEATATNLFILNSGTNELAHVEAELDNCRRSNPQTFFGKKLIVCEGKTEYGFLRELDMKLDTKYNANFSTNGVVVVNAGGGDKMYTYALMHRKHSMK